MTPASTDRIPKQFRFEQPKLVPVVVNFQGGQVTSDAGLSLIAEIDRKLQITSQFALCFQDYRNADFSQNLKKRDQKLRKCIYSKYFSSYRA
ncbi:transposase [Nostoc sp. KVJ3]|uniref:transposase n=1 Tax=Nostoc sp. KVJ3 TaxID=457945 RepID=UPI00223882F1|nr:transposase [Nostoc sp. KVJ3]